MTRLLWIDIGTTTCWPDGCFLLEIGYGTETSYYHVILSPHLPIVVNSVDYCRSLIPW